MKCQKRNNHEASENTHNSSGDNQVKSSRWTVNRKLLPLKIFNFFYYGAAGTAVPFIPICLRRLELRASEIGLITGASVLLAMFCRPVIGLAADKLNLRKFALVACCMVFGGSFSLLWFVPGRTLTASTGSNDTSWLCPEDLRVNFESCQINSQTQTIFECHNTTSRKTYLDQIGYENFLILFKSTNENVLYNNNNNNNVKPSLSPLHCYFLTPEQSQNFNATSMGYSRSSRNVFDPELQSDSLNFRFSQFISGCLKNCSAILTSSLKTSGNGTNISWANSELTEESKTRFITMDTAFSISFLILVVSRAFYSSSNSLTDAVTYTILGNDRLKWGEQRLWGTIGTAIAVLLVTSLNDVLQASNYGALFLSCLVWTGVACVAGTLKLKCDRVPKNEHFRDDIGSVLKSLAVRIFFCKLLLFGMLCGSSQNFFVWFIVDIGGSQINLGLTLLVNCFSSVIVLRCSRRFFTLFGQQRAMQFVLCCYIVRYLAYSFMQSPWFAMLIDTIHGVTYSMLWAAASSTASMVAPPGTQATCQGLAGAIYWDFGRGVGTVLTGQIIGLIGARSTFRVLGGVSAATLLLCCLLDHVWPIASMDKSQTNNGGQKESIDQTSPRLSSSKASENQNQTCCLIQSQTAQKSHSKDAVPTSVEDQTEDVDLTLAEETTILNVDSDIIFENCTCESKIYPSENGRHYCGDLDSFTPLLSSQNDQETYSNNTNQQIMNSSSLSVKDKRDDKAESLLQETQSPGQVSVDLDLDLGNEFNTIMDPLPNSVDIVDEEGRDSDSDSDSQKKVTVEKEQFVTEVDLGRRSAVHYDDDSGNETRSHLDADDDDDASKKTFTKHKKEQNTLGLGHQGKGIRISISPNTVIRNE